MPDHSISTAAFQKSGCRANPTGSVRFGQISLTGESLTGFEGIITALGSKVTYDVSVSVLDIFTGCRVVGQVTY